MEGKHIEEVVSIHAAALEDYYTARLGSFYLRNVFWPAVLQHERTKTFVARSSQQMAGFIVCTLDAEGLKRAILAHSFFVGNAILVVKSVLDPLVRASSIESIKKLFRKKAGLPPAELFLVAVAPCCRNRKIGSSLLNKMDEFFYASKVNEAFLRVKSSNTVALGLYKKSGFYPTFERQETNIDWIYMKKCFERANRSN